MNAHSNPDLRILPAGRRDPVHPSLSEELISELVERFYEKVQQNGQIGTIFTTRLEGKWPMHLDRMKRFWSSVLLKSGRYKGKPIPVHMAISEINSDDYRIWLKIFRETANEVLGKEAAAPAISAAERIAESLWMAKFATPFDKIPRWLNQSSR